MVAWGVTDAGVDTASTTLLDRDGGTFDPSAFIRQLDSHENSDGERISYGVDACYRGETERLVLPSTDVTIAPPNGEPQTHLTTSETLGTGPHHLSFTVFAEGAQRSGPSKTKSGTQVTVCVDGPATVRATGERSVLSLPAPSDVTIGFREVAESLHPRIQVPKTVEGVATAVSYMSSAHLTMRPSRSHPELRGHPPMVETGQSTQIPAEIRNDRPDTGIHLRVPESIADVYVTAPLAYYLGAKVTTEARETAVLTAEDTTVKVTFDPRPSLEQEVSHFLRKVFYLDCLVRRVDQNERRQLNPSNLSLDPETVRSLSPAGRLERYLEIPTAAIDAVMPEWPLSTYVSPDLERASCLPFLLDRLSLVYMPNGSELDQRALLDKTLADSFTTRGSTAERPSVLDPDLQAGRLHAWLAPGTPIDACKTPPEAYENRQRYEASTTAQLTVAVVLNDEEMADEHTEVTEIYRAADLPMDLRVREQLTTRELAAVFETHTDFVHFIGHCDDDGLRCPDGNLSLNSLDNAQTRTFFLNACGSYDEGLGLVEQGAVAGAVTFTDVIDKHAAMVGTAFARLLSNGFSIQRALELARRRIMMGKDYAVVGDGTYSIIPGPAQPAVVWLSRTASGFELTCEVVSPERPGESYRLPFGDSSTLNGEQTTHSLGTDKLVDILAETSLPVIFDGEFHWSDDLAARLRNGFCDSC